MDTTYKYSYILGPAFTHSIPHHLMLYRALIKTHHMTSRKKIQRLCKATRAQQCSVVIKTGLPPGVMIAEGEEQGNVQEWIKVVKAMRYKFYDLLCFEEVGEHQGRLLVEPGHVQEFTEMKHMDTFLESCKAKQWWATKMGFPRCS